MRLGRGRRRHFPHSTFGARASRCRDGMFAFAVLSNWFATPDSVARPDDRLGLRQIKGNGSLDFSWGRLSVQLWSYDKRVDCDESSRLSKRMRAKFVFG